MQILTKTLIKVMEKSPHELTRVIYLCVNKVSQTESATNRIVSSLRLLLTFASLSFSLPRRLHLIMLESNWELEKLC